MGIRTDLVDHARQTADRTLLRFDGLTDEEFRWQPAPGSWTVHKLASGRVVLDNNTYQPIPPPPPSIAWRIAHLIDIYGAPRNSEWLRVVPPPTPPIPNSPWTIAWTADESLAILRTAIDHFVGLLSSIDDDTWWELLGPQAAPWSEASLAAFALHQIDEAIHHAAEAAVLRDLYGALRVGPPPEPATVAEAAAAGRWNVVDSLVRAGADVNGPPPTALHLAAAVGDLELVRLLVDHGADRSVRDLTFEATPAAWARYFGHDVVATYLDSLD